MTRLDGKVAVVTGSSGGIGRGVALRLGALGARVVVTGRSEVRGAAVVAEIGEAGGEAIFLPGDVRRRDDMDALATATSRRCGGIDIVVVAAGGLDDEARSPDVRGPFQENDLARVTAFVGEALAAKLNPVQAALPSMRERGGGSVVFVTSVGGRVPTSGQTAIASFSGGLLSASAVLAKELAPSGIRVNAVCVTVVRDTPSWQAVFGPESAVSDQHRRQYEAVVERAPLGVADPGDIGGVVAFLASDAARHLTGAVLSPTGGLTPG